MVEALRLPSSVFEATVVPSGAVMIMIPSAPPLAKRPSRSITTVFARPGPSMAQPWARTAEVSAAACRYSANGEPGAEVAMRWIPRASAVNDIACTGAPHPSTPVVAIRSPVKRSTTSRIRTCSGWSGCR
ncbi:hypothetical protein CMMCAS05_08155 [Clavibacter michiganensis subsp. michiganensis]|nr:hypothetical protein CMMCAS05_08155 [Clavibacter michiganensis subsp. michiganensis]